MRIVRSIVAIVAGYLVFGLTGAAFFLVTKQNPHASASHTLIAATTVYGMVFAFLGGYVAARLAPSKPFRHATSVWLLVSAGAAASILTSPAADPIWSQVATLVLMAPMALLGGWAQSRRSLVSVSD